MARRELPEINAGSMADIAFLLLIFFLVTTTMDVDSGLMRKLPPMEDEKPDKPPEVRERNVFVVLINKRNDLLVEGRPMVITELKEATKEFITNPRNKKNLSEKTSKVVPFFNKVDVSKGVVSLQNDRGTSYEKYVEVQNELMAAYNELRNDIAKSKFSRFYDECNEDQQNAIRKIYPLSISEAEPKNYGGK